MQTGADDDGNAATAPAKVDVAQAGQLRDLASETGASLPAFLGWLKVESLEDLPAERFGEALAALHDVAAQRKARQAQS